MCADLRVDRSLFIFGAGLAFVAVTASGCRSGDGPNDTEKGAGRRAECLAATGQLVARSGRIEAGPFDAANIEEWLNPDTHSAKLWVCLESWTQHS